MSDPRYTDPRLSDPPLQDDQRQRLGELDQSSTMWGWVAGGIVLALLLVFVFGRSPTSDQPSTAMTAPPPGPTTLAPPSSPPTPPIAAERPAPSTTGQGSTAQ
jgi:hypothetical protein